MASGGAHLIVRPPGEADARARPRLRYRPGAGARAAIEYGSAQGLTPAPARFSP